MRRPRLRPTLRPLRHQRRCMARQRQRAAGSRPRANATRSTRPTRRRSGHRARRSVSLSLLAVPATRPFRREPPQRRQRPLSRVPCSHGNGPPARPQLPPAMARRLLQVARGNSRQSSKRATAARPIRSFGSTRNPASTISQGPRITRPYEAARVHVRGRRQGGWRSGRHERKASSRSRQRRSHRNTIAPPLPGARVRTHKVVGMMSGM